MQMWREMQVCPCTITTIILPQHHQQATHGKKRPCPYLVSPKVAGMVMIASLIIHGVGEWTSHQHHPG
eukprot:8612090-Prorocentrum_lima.AAC.1